MRQSQAETRRQNVAKRSMTKEAKQLTGLIAGLRRSSMGSTRSGRAQSSPAPRWACSTSAATICCYHRSPRRPPLGGAGADRSRPSPHHPRSLGGCRGLARTSRRRALSPMRWAAPRWNPLRHHAAVTGTKLPRSRRIAAKARCHERAGCRATQGAHWPTKWSQNATTQKYGFARESRLLIVAKAKVVGERGVAGRHYRPGRQEHYAPPSLINCWRRDR